MITWIILVFFLVAVYFAVSTKRKLRRLEKNLGLDKPLFADEPAPTLAKMRERMMAEGTETRKEFGTRKTRSF